MAKPSERVKSDAYRIGSGHICDHIIFCHLSFAQWPPAGRFDWEPCARRQSSRRGIFNNVKSTGAAQWSCPQRLFAAQAGQPTAVLLFAGRPSQVIATGPSGALRQS